jgi:hypothetical protein
LATHVLGGRVSSAVEGIDSFAYSAFPDNILALFERGTSSSSSELDKSRYEFQPNRKNLSTSKKKRLKGKTYNIDSKSSSSAKSLVDPFVT